MEEADVHRTATSLRWSSERTDEREARSSGGRRPGVREENCIGVVAVRGRSPLCGGAAEAAAQETKGAVVGVEVDAGSGRGGSGDCRAGAGWIRAGGRRECGSPGFPHAAPPAAARAPLLKGGPVRGAGRGGARQVEVGEPPWGSGGGLVPGAGHRRGRRCLDLVPARAGKGGRVPWVTAARR